jgi:hypothetical protein
MIQTAINGATYLVLVVLSLLIVPIGNDLVMWIVRRLHGNALPTWAVTLLWLGLLWFTIPFLLCVVALIPVFLIEESFSYAPSLPYRGAYLVAYCLELLLAGGLYASVCENRK